MKTLTEKIFLMFLILPLIMGLLVSNADALSLDLTTLGESGTINGTIFYTPSTVTSGTGLIDSFLRMQAANTLSESGYNTDGKLEFDTKAGGFTHSLQLSDLQTNIVDIGGTNYYEFVLDVNETPSNGLITLFDFEFYIDHAPDNTGYLSGSLGTLVYDFDFGQDGDSSVTVDYNNFQGSGKLDLFALVPTSYFGTDLGQYVYLYTGFGPPDDVVDDGFEEWAHKSIGTFTPPDPVPPTPPDPIPPTEPTPEPATALLFIAGIMGFFGVGLKRKR